MSTIDITKEKLILFSELPKHLPPQPSGKRIHLSACYRWKSIGLCGIRLPTVFIAGNRYRLKHSTAFGQKSQPPKMAGKSNILAHKQVKADADGELQKAGW